MRKALVLLSGFILVSGCISVETRDEVFIDAKNARISIGFMPLRGSDMASTPIPLSSSTGGAGVILDDQTLPGKIIHENPVDSNTNHLITDILAVNPNASAITLWAAYQGPGLPVPTSTDEMIRIDVPPTPEGNEPRLFYTPFILSPGYSYHISVPLQAGQIAPYLVGYAETFPASGVLGYGGLIRRADYTIASIPLATWIVMDFEEGMVTDPVNVSQEPGNNRFAVNAPGIWFASTYGSFTCDKNANDDRVIYTRFYNETDGQPVTPSPWPTFIENNSNNALWSYSTFFEVPESLVGKFIRAEIGDPDIAFSNVVIHKTGVTLARIAPELGA